MDIKIQTHKNLKDYASVLTAISTVVGGTTGDFKMFFN